MSTDTTAPADTDELMADDPHEHKDAPLDETLDEAGFDVGPDLQIEEDGQISIDPDAEGDRDLTDVDLDDIHCPKAVGQDARLRKSMGALPIFTTVTLRTFTESEREQFLEKHGESAPKYCVVAGKRRVSIAKDQGRDSIPALVIPDQYRNLAPAIALAENIARDPDPIQEAMALYRLRRAGYTEEHLKEMGIPAQRQKKALRLALAPSTILEGVYEDDIAPGTARRVSNMEAALQKRCAQYYKENGRLRGKDVTRISQEAKNEEAEALGDSLFEETPDATDLENGKTSRSRVNSGASHANAGDEPQSTSSLEFLSEAVSAALSEGYSEREILNVVHDELKRE